MTTIEHPPQPDEIIFQETKENKKRTELLDKIFTELAKKLKNSVLPFNHNLEVLTSTTTPKKETKETSFQEAINKPGLILKKERSSLKDDSEKHRGKHIIRKTESQQSKIKTDKTETKIRVTDNRSVAENPNHPQINNNDAKVQIEILETETKIENISEIKTKINLVLPLELVLGNAENSSWKMTALKEKYPLLEKIIKEQIAIEKLTINKLKISDLPIWLQLEIEIDNNNVVKITKLKTQHIKNKLKLHFENHPILADRRKHLELKKQVIIETDYLTEKTKEKKFLPMSSIKAKSPEEWSMFDRSLETKKESI